MYTSTLKNFTPNHPQHDCRHLHTHTPKHVCNHTNTHTHTRACPHQHTQYMHHTQTHVLNHTNTRTPTHTVHIHIPLHTSLHSAGCRFPNLVHLSLALISPQLTQLCQFAPRDARTPQCFGGSRSSRHGCKVKHQNSAESDKLSEHAAKPTNKIVSKCNFRALGILNSILSLSPLREQNKTNL